MIFSHADMLTGCPLDANIIKFRAYRRSIVVIRLVCMSRETWVGMSTAFVYDEDFYILCTGHACGRVHSIFFCCPGFGLHTHLL